MAENIISQSILIESASARSETLVKFSDERSLEILNKAKAAILAVWRSSGYATVEQVAQYYEVGEEAIKSIIKRHESELKQDGAKKLTGKALQEVRVSLNLTSSVPHLWVFTPRALLRTGFILAQSAVAAEVRTQALNLIESVPAQVEMISEQSDRIKELELKLRIAEAESRTAEANVVVRQVDNSMLLMHGQAVVLALRGMSNQVVEVDRKITEVIDDKTGVSFAGQTLVQIKDHISQKHGFKMKSGAEVRRRLEAMKREDLIAQMKRPVLQDYIPLENIEEVVRLLTQGDRQLLLGE